MKTLLLALLLGLLGADGAGAVDPRDGDLITCFYGDGPRITESDPGCCKTDADCGEGGGRCEGTRCVPGTTTTTLPESSLSFDSDGNTLTISAPDSAVSWSVATDAYPVWIDKRTYTCHEEETRWVCEPRRECGGVKLEAR
jgi:hypothetical protein